MTIAERLGLGKAGNTPSDDDTYIDAAALVKPQRRVPREVLFVAVLLLSMSASFGMGMLAGRENRAGDPNDHLWIEKLGQAAPAAVVEASTSAPEVAVTPAPKPAPKKTPAGAKATSGQFVASKTGTKYYLPWCGSVKRIKDENKVWFGSKAEAEKAGYSAAKNCKGL